MEVGRDDCDIMRLHLVCMDLTHTIQIPHFRRSPNSQTPPWSPIDESEQDSAYFPLPREENIVAVLSHFTCEYFSIMFHVQVGGHRWGDHVGCVVAG